MVRYFLTGVAGLFLLVFTAQAQAQQKITPSHVLQSVDNVVGELALLLDANFSDASIPAPTPVQGKRPRHVIQKARQILLQVQLLKQINGIEIKDLEPIAVREIRPADVKGWADKVLVAVRELRAPYKITATAPAAALEAKKSPSDVFQRLLQVEKMVKRLDLPATVPNDVYRVTLSLVDDMRVVARGIGITDAVIWQSRTAKGKSPADAYNASYALLEDLKKLTSINASLNIPGSIKLPSKKTSGVTPGDVIEVQNTLLAELSSLKNKVQVKQPTKVFPPQAAKTPSDVYVAVGAAAEYAALAIASAQAAAPAN